MNIIDKATAADIEQELTQIKSKIRNHEAYFYLK